MAGALQALAAGGLGGQNAANPLNMSGGNGNSSIALNQGSGNSAATPSPAPSPIQQATSGVNNSQAIAGAQQEYGSQIQGDQAQLAANAAGNAVNNADVNANYGAQLNSINQQAQSGLNTLQTQNSGVQSQQQLSLAELADQIHGQNQGLTNQLGTMGAGSSSAVGTGQQALAKVQNTDRANIQEGAGVQSANIGAEQNAVTAQQQSQLQSLGQWKQQQLDQIVQTFQQNQNSINSAMQSASGEEQLRLASLGVALKNNTSAALQQLDQQIGNTVANITAYNVAQAPTIAAPVATPQPTAITAPAVSPFNVGNSGSANTTAAPTGGSVYDLMQQNAPTTP